LCAGWLICLAFLVFGMVADLRAETLPERGAASHEPAQRWREAFVTGNGRMGAMLFGGVEQDTLVGNHCRLYLPRGSREIVSDLAAELPEYRRLIRGEGYEVAKDYLNKIAAAQGDEGLVRTDPFHPGFFIHIHQEPEGEIQDYVRTQDFRTGELTVRWRDDRGLFQRRVFVSRTLNLIVCSLTPPAGADLDCDLEFPLPAPPDIRVKGSTWRADVKKGMIDTRRTIAPDLVTFHNTYTMGKGGYDAAIRILTTGGSVEAVGDRLRVRGAREVLMLMRMVPWKTPMPPEQSEAWAYSPKHPDFQERVGRFDPGPSLADSSVVPYLKDADALVLMPQLVESLKAVESSYEALFASHAKAHGALFERVSIDLGGNADRRRTSADLLAETQRTGKLSPALAEKIYDAGRYMFICCAGELPPNLQGIWTGFWRPAWSGDFTLDTNLQLAMKHAYSGNLAELMEGYFRLIEGFYPEWRLNAKRMFGCDGFMTNVRASNTALLLHCGPWIGGRNWTGGCGWLAHFFFDYWQYTGDTDFLRERAYPLLKEVLAFYEDFLLVDENGLYEFIPSYSPESSAGITATMDVMILKDVLRSLITASRVLKIDTDSIPTWESMLAKLPDYRINEDGALAEWIPEGGSEHYQHRHLSHLHSCYEALEDPELDNHPAMLKAARKALMLRIESGGEVSSHGRVHQGLAAAHLGMGDVAFGRIETMAVGASMYDSLMCSHEPGEAIFNVDANGAIPEIIHRMLVRSYPGRLDLLPALPTAWPKGEIRGIRIRQQITIERLTWDTETRHLTLVLESDRDKTLSLRLPGTASTPTRSQIELKQGQSRILDLTW
jgi:alpha-L-fucosidase 2